ncbi:MAG: type 1 glutamine amidotransferase [Kangiellaceae bacterium]
MAKIMVLQHVPYEPLGTLDPLIRERRHKIKYVNFGRSPEVQPNLKGYHALIILGGPMNIGEELTYPHLDTEKQLVLEAIKMNIPVLGICLGAQLIASALGAKVYQLDEAEIGWYTLSRPTSYNAQTENPIGSLFSDKQKIFQWHGFTFDLPAQAELILEGNQVKNQAFKINGNVFGFQFHLEADRALIKRWLELPAHQKELGLDKSKNRIEWIKAETEKEIEQSLELSNKIFSAFLDFIPSPRLFHRFTHK